jgi:putative ABC transport system permease protein
MFKNYLIMALRNAKKQQVYFSINVMGLGIALGACFLLLLYALNEFSYDRYHPNADQTYRILTLELDNNRYDGTTPYPFAEIIRNNIPGVDRVSQLCLEDIKFFLSNQEQSEELQFAFTDQEMFELFDVPILSGLPYQKWNDPFQIYISEQLGERYFPGANPVGQTILIDENNHRMTLKIAGLFKTLPSNTHLDMDVIAPMSLALKIYQNQEFLGFKFQAFDSWERSPLHTYIKIKKGADIQNIKSQLKQIAQSHIKDSGNIDYELQPIQNIHLHSANINNSGGVQGNLQQILLLLAIALLILIIAVFNFILLSTARSNTRLQEIGMRKALGAQKQDIIRQTLAETTFTAILSLPVALLFAEMILPLFNSLVEKNLILLNWRNWPFIICVIGLTLLVGILSGSYTAFHYSRFQPHQILKTAHLPFYSKSVLRRLLIVAQFVIFIGLLICTVTIFQQFHYIQHKNLGYDKENLVTIPLTNKQTVNSYPILKNKLKESPYIINVSGASYTPPTETFIWAKFADYDKSIEFIFVDRDYFETMGIKVLEGHVFSEERLSDDKGVVLTASSIPYLDLENPLGQDLFGMGQILGIVEDFHIRSLHRSIRPVMFKLDPGKTSTVVIRLQPNVISEALKEVKQIWREINTDVPFSFQFVDEALNQAYRSDLRFGRLIQMFTVLAIFIASLGLFGLSMFMTEQKTKEIGVRKVLGASVNSILRLLTLDIIKWIVLANLLAWPVTWYAMSKWLQNFAYRIDLTVWPFLLAGLTALVIALLTVSWQAIRAATANPVEALRYE